MGFKGMTVGVPREVMAGEQRVAAVPDTVQQMVGAGARVLVQHGAGEGAFFYDREFEEAGAEIIEEASEIYRQSDLVLKVKEPRENEEVGMHEAEMLREGGKLVSFLHPAHPLNHSMVKKLAEREITSFTLDGIPRISRAQKMDCLTSMSTVAGYKAAIFAAYSLARFIPMMPTSLGVINPARFLVVGTGVAGLQALAMAKRMGAQVKSLDIRPEAVEQAGSLGAENIPFDIPRDLAVGEGGYARRLPEEWYQKEREVLAEHVAKSDAVILTALIPGEEAPVLVDEQMVKEMRKGSVVVDIAVDQGGNCSLTRYGEEYSYGGVHISGIMNIPATLAQDATRMFAQNAFQFIQYLVEDGEVKTDTADEIIEGTLVTHRGEVVHRGTIKAMEK